MLEMRVEFRSVAEWTKWLDEHRAKFDEWRAEILQDVTRHGLLEPVSGVQHKPVSVAIDFRNLRESVSVMELNSRKRAGLLALDLAHRRLPADRRNRARILGAEGTTRAARLLRGAFSYFLGTEYLPTAEEREKHYPIPHLDLMDAALPDAAFDMFYSSDVLEHVPDLARAFAEVARMLRPGGVMVSTFPFNPSAETTQRRASLDPAGAPIHHLPAEYHGDPIRPSEGALVFSVPGWDVFEAARAAGLADPRMTLILSSGFGIVSAPVPGIFVMSALKGEVGDARPQARQFVYRGPRLRRLVGLAGIARSGTTLLCSILGVHSRIEAVYEPFNVNKTRDLPPRLGIGRFFAEFPTEMRGKDILLVKETGTQIAFLDRTTELLRSAAPPIGADLIVLFRNPFHAFLSVLEAQKKWWGGQHEITAQTFQAWAHHNLAALARLLRMAREFNAVCVSYEAVVGRPEVVIPTLMDLLGFEFEPRQLDFEKFVDRRRVRGDITIATEPGAISGAPVVHREAELAEFAERIGQAPHHSRVEQVAELIAALQAAGCGRFGSRQIQPVMRPLGELLLK